MKAEQARQTILFESPILPEETVHVQDSEWGTFKDSLRAPVHNWFTYPAGFSFKAVESSLHRYAIGSQHTVYDPFMGTGTTNVVAKTRGVSSCGVEAHPFVFQIAKAKMNWNVRNADVMTAIDDIEKASLSDPASVRQMTARVEAEFPELVLKCYGVNTLYSLLCIRQHVREQKMNPSTRDFLLVALTALLRNISSAHTGWPYIAPKKVKVSSAAKNAALEFKRQVLKMTGDLEAIRARAEACYKQSKHGLFNADSRDTKELIESNTIDHIFTSPPYLNNFDYADRTRLEMYFFGLAKTWGDITELVRTQLITSATTQIQRDDPRYVLDPGLKRADSSVYQFLDRAVTELSELRLTKGGKKSYDHLVAGYFNDMLKVLRDCYRVLRRNGVAVFVLGDSAPYGVHIPTDEFIGKLGAGIGFRDFQIDVLRSRGGKWKANPQRHNVSLRESIVTLIK